MPTNYDVDYFIKKFEAIPDENWTTKNFVNPENSEQMCAMGHCGERRDVSSTEGDYLARIFYSYSASHPVSVNDNRDDLYTHLGDTPRKRILEALRRIKEGENMYGF